MESFLSCLGGVRRECRKQTMTKTKFDRATAVQAALLEQAVAEKAISFSRFFKAGPGEYAEGDQFLGVTVPDQRKIARQFRELPPAEIQQLLKNPYHECRLTGVLILVSQFEHARTESDRKLLYDFYLTHVNCINNWDLVDSSAPKIVGSFLWQKNHQPLFKLARTNHLWKNRIAIVATQYFIKHGQPETTLELAELLLNHRHDLIHKAVGWMLREVGEKNQPRLFAFLNQHVSQMPRTMLRYAIEKLPESKRQSFLKK